MTGRRWTTSTLIAVLAVTGAACGQRTDSGDVTSVGGSQAVTVDDPTSGDDRDPGTGTGSTTADGVPAAGTDATGDGAGATDEREEVVQEPGTDEVEESAEASAEPAPDDGATGDGATGDGATGEGSTLTDAELRDLEATLDDIDRLIADLEADLEQD